MKAPAARRQEHCSTVLLTSATEATRNTEYNKQVTEEHDRLWHILQGTESVKDLEVGINSVST